MQFVSRSFLFLLTFGLLMDFERSYSDVGTVAGGPIIEVKAVVNIGEKSEITFGDILELRGIDSTTSERLTKIRLADAPPSGEVRSFTDVGLDRLLRESLSHIGVESLAKISLRIPSRVTVIKNSLVPTRQEVETRLKKLFKSRCGSCDIQISGLSLPAMDVEDSSVRGWDLRARTELPRGSFSLPLDVEFRNGGQKSYWITGILTVSKPVYVASRSMDIGEKIELTDWNLQTKEITFATDIEASLAEMNGAVLTRRISAGQILWRSLLRKEPLTKLGDMVRVVVGQDEWSVSVEGVAQSIAYRGDILRVKIPRTNKIVSGRLIEKDRVEVRQ